MGLSENGLQSHNGDTSVTKVTKTAFPFFAFEDGGGVLHHLFHKIGMDSFHCTWIAPWGQVRMHSAHPTQFSGIDLSFLCFAFTVTSIASASAPDCAFPHPTHFFRLTLGEMLEC